MSDKREVVSVVELEGTHNYMFKIAAHPEWQKALTWHKDITVNKVEYRVVSTSETVLKLCLPYVRKALLRGVDSNKTWHYIASGALNE